MKKFKSTDYTSEVTQEQLSKERWVDVFVDGINYAYKISDCGRLLSSKTGKILKPSLDKRGYPQNTFYKSAQITTTRRVHRLVAGHFIKNPDNLPEVNHIDGNKFNPHYSNLEYNTSKQNKQHAIELGMAKMPPTHLTRKKVINNDSGEIFESLVVASKKSNFDYKYLSLMLSGKAKNKTSFTYL